VPTGCGRSDRSRSIMGHTLALAEAAALEDEGRTSADRNTGAMWVSNTEIWVK